MIISTDLICDNDLILGGDLILTLFVAKYWGSGVMVDPMTNYSRSIFYESKLIDVMPGVRKPTLKNGRLSDVGVAKRLDIFIVT